MVVVAVPLAWKFNRLRTQRRVVQAARNSEAGVVYDYSADRQPGEDTEPPGPPWLRRMLGDDIFAQIVWIVWSDQEIPDETFSDIAALPALRLFSAKHVTDEHLERISQISSLTHLEIEGEFTDEAIAKLSRLPKLETLHVKSPHLTDQALAHLQEFKAVRRVQVLSSQPISDEAEETLRQAIPDGNVAVIRAEKP